VVRRGVAGGRDSGSAAGGQNTSIGVVATNVRLTKSEATKVPRWRTNGLARAHPPTHTPWDGDTPLRAVDRRPVARGAGLLVGSLAAEVVGAGRRAPCGPDAAGLPGLPAASDLAAGRGA